MYLTQKWRLIELPRSIIDWGTFIVDWRLVMARAGEQIGLSWPSLSDKAAAEIDQFLSPDLRHHISDPAELAVHPNVNEWVQESYRALLALATDPLSNSARQTLHDIRVEFDKASKMFGGAIVEFEQNLTRSNLEIKTAKRERDSLIAENKNFQQAAGDERERLTAELAEHVARTNALAAERDAFQQQLQAAATERERLTAELAEHVARTNALAAERDAFQQQLQAAATERERLTAELAGHVARTNALAAERDAFQQQLQAAATERERLTAELAGHVARTNALAAERDAFQQQLQAAATERERLTAELSGQVARTNTLAAERDAFQLQLQAAATERERLTAELSGQVVRTNALAAERDAFQQQMQAAATRLQEQSELTRQLELRVQDAERLAKLQKDVMVGEVERFRANLNEAVMQRDTSRQIVRQHSAIIQRLHQELGVVQQHQEFLQGKLSSAQQQNDELQGILSSAQQQNDELQGILSSAQQQNDELQGILSSAQQQNDELQGILSSAQQQNDELRQTATILGEQNRVFLERNEQIARLVRYIPGPLKRSLKLLVFRSSLRD